MFERTQTSEGNAYCMPMLLKAYKDVKYFIQNFGVNEHITKLDKHFALGFSFIWIMFFLFFVFFILKGWGGGHVDFRWIFFIFVV